MSANSPVDSSTVSATLAAGAATQAPKTQTAPGRYWEIDTWRGIAVCTMIVYHFTWDLWYFRLLPPGFDFFGGFWKYLQRFTATSFLLLVGISLTVSYRYAIQGKDNSTGLFPKFLKRGLKIFGLGLIITVVTFFAGVGTIHFGILHLIGLSIILAYPFLRFRWLNFLLWIIFFVAGYFVYVDPIFVATNLFLWTGLHTMDYYASDYFPLVPWFGVVLLGIFLGNTLYSDAGRRFYLPDWGNLLPFRSLQFLGRHSLFIYMVHQVVLYVLAFALMLVRIWWIGQQF
jgi:uncharacterized membrane protein